MPTRKPLEIPSFSLETTNLVKESAQVLFSNTSINYFVYIKGTIDGALSILFSDAGFSLDWLDKGFTPGTGYSQEYKGLQTFSYFWEEKLPAELMSLAREKHHLNNGIAIVRRYKKYFELFGFADSNNYPMASVYASCLDDLNNFADYFVKSNKYLIGQVTEHPLFFPSSLSIPTHREICLASNRSQFQVTGPLGDVGLTSREFFCLQLYVGGRPYKEIGKILSVSDKMVEKHLRNIKAKLGYHPRNISFLQEESGKLQVQMDILRKSGR